MIDFRQELKLRDYKLVDDGAGVIVISASDKQERVQFHPRPTTMIARRYESLQVAYIELVKNREQRLSA